jgi:lipoate-protein ligase A
MRLLDLSFDSPEENLAMDEAILDAVESGQSPATLRFWECPVPFVVIGSAQTLHKEVHEDHCAADGVPVLRRCTAGGCVLQGPGSLNYALMLPYAEFPETRDLHQSYCLILDRMAGALASLGVSARHEGVCDLAVSGLKVSGNAQRRKKHAFLHHGTLLYRADYDGMARYLREPQDRPGYRGERNHRDFVGELPPTPEALRAAARNTFAIEGPSAEPTPEELAAMRQLVTEKYTTPAWTHRK